MTVDPVQRNAWRRLKRNKVAFGGLIVIILFTLMAVFAYFISPDSSPNANRMIVEIGGRKPGFTQQFLKLPTAGIGPQTSLLEQLLFGKTDRFEYVPVEGVNWRQDRVGVEKYIDEGLTERLA